VRFSFRSTLLFQYEAFQERLPGRLDGLIRNRRRFNWHGKGQDKEGFSCRNDDELLAIAPLQTHSIRPIPVPTTHGEGADIERGHPVPDQHLTQLLSRLALFVSRLPARQEMRGRLVTGVGTAKEVGLYGVESTNLMTYFRTLSVGIRSNPLKFFCSFLC